MVRGISAHEVRTCPVYFSTRDNLPGHLAICVNNIIMCIGLVHDIFTRNIYYGVDMNFADTEAAAFRGRPRTSLPTTLCSDLRRIGRTLRQPTDIEALRALSREQWRQMERDISA